MVKLYLHSGCAGLVMLGGRFKKEVVLDGQSYLLLIRDEGGLPEMQVLLPASFDYCLSRLKLLHCLSYFVKPSVCCLKDY